ncbi:MAG: hypothetical protein EOM40_01320 [Clostridia bacterium]|nr:hypothetical protein [Clostridia bacterium]NCC42715.1 hypothetical protein [Clostridia bacterium]
MNQFREKVMRFMQGRYGMDDMGRFLMIVILVCMVLSVVFQSGTLNILVVAGIVYEYYRMLSRNIAARYEENQKFLGLKSRLFSKGAPTFQRRAADPVNRVFKCPTCGQKVRVPKGKGKISIHCPKCNSDFVKRS